MLEYNAKRFNELIRMNSISMDHGTRYTNYITTSETLGAAMGGGNLRYRDPLVRNDINNVSDPSHRELVAENNPIAIRYTSGFLSKMLAKDLVFTTGPKPTDPIHKASDDLVAFLKKSELMDYIYRAGMFHLIHGWQVTIPQIAWKDPEDHNKGALSIDLRECVSEREIPANQIVRVTTMDVEAFKEKLRDLQAKAAETKQEIDLPPLPHINDIKAYRVSYQPHVPLFREQAGLYVPGMRVFPAGTLFHTYHQTYNYGFGVSELGQAWDSIVKLGEVSDNNHFRQSIVMDAIFDPRWDESMATQYMQRVVYALNNKQIVGRWPYTNNAGEPNAQVPSLNFLNAVRDQAPTKDSMGSGGGLGDLTSPWAYLSSVTKYTTRYWLGNPGGALAAADVDDLNDVVNDIVRFRVIITCLIEPLLKYLQQLQLIPKTIDLTKIYVKSWLQAEFEAEYLRSIGLAPGNMADENNNTIPDALEGQNAPQLRQGGAPQPRVERGKERQGRNAPTKPTPQLKAPAPKPTQPKQNAIPDGVYINRDLSNNLDFHTWAESVGLVPHWDYEKEEGFYPRYHTTIAYSEKPFTVPPLLTDYLAIPPEQFIRLAKLGEALVLEFVSPDLHDRWDEFRAAGAEWSYPEYKAHVTITHDVPAGLDLISIPLPTFVLQFGPEVRETFDTEWESKTRQNEFLIDGIEPLIEIDWRGYE